MAAIPHANEVEAAGKHAGLEDAEEEAGGEQAAVALDNSLHSGREAEEEHVDRQPDMGPEALEQDIARDLEDDVCVTLVSRVPWGWRRGRDVQGTKKMTSATLYSFPARFRSSDRPKTLALAMLTRSRKARRYMIHKKGTTWKSMRRTNLRSVV